MIDPRLFTVERLIAEMIGDTHNGRTWMRDAEIVPDYMPPYPRPETKPACVVRFGGWFLRYSSGPRQGYFWDCYGDPMLSPELALLALLEAPVPPCVMKPRAERLRLAAAEAKP